MMYQRPKPDETEEDLLKQYEEFKSKPKEEATPAARVVRVGKRKTEELAKPSPIEQSEQSKKREKPKSKFAEARSKKKKQGVVDNTILKEADSREGHKAAVLTPIVPRNVPSLSPMMMRWDPTPNPLGFPKAPKLNLKENVASSVTESETSGDTCSRKKSLYMQQMEEKVEINNLRSSAISDISVDDKLALLGKKSYILDGSSGLGKSEEAEVIHQENITKLSTMTHEERLRERNEIMARLSPEQIAFLHERRRKKEEALKCQSMEVDGERELTPRPSILKKVDTPEKENVEDEAMDQGNLQGNSSSAPSGQSAKCVQFEEEVNLSELPIAPKEAAKWVHMDKVELDKLRWTTDLPKPKPLKGKEGYVARFNFQGDLLPYNADVSWREGLHHHGEEPGRAGYTLDELFVFVRSQVIQQRNLGLKTLGNIIRNSNEGLYDSCFETPILQLMIDAGVVLLLRFAIDEKTPLIHQEALRALYFLVSSEPDERCLSISEPWVPLGVQPGFSSFTHSREKVREELDAEEKELKDIEVIKLDVIRALVRMDVHIRLRYLLESRALSPPDVLYTLGILRRIARHSLTAAWTLVKTPRLLAVITEHFLPHDPTQVLCGSNVEKMTSVYGVPLSHALSFMKVLASRGRQIAVTLVDNHDLISRVMAYVSIEPTEIQMPLPEVLLLAQEAYSLWSIFLSYGLSKSQQGFATFYPLIVKQLVFYRDKVDLNQSIENNQYNYEVGAHLGNVLAKALSIAATKTLLTTRMKNNEGSVSSPGQKDVVLQPPILDWEDFGEILGLAEICLMKWMTQLKDVEVSFSGLKLLGSFCNLLDVYVRKWRDQRCFEGVTFTKKIEHVLTKILAPLTSSVYERLLKRLREHSALTSKLKLGQSRDALNLGSLASVSQEGKVTPILQKDSPFPLLLPLTNLLITMYSLCPSLDPSPITCVLNNDHLKHYLSEVCSSEHSLSTQWFSRVEIITLGNMLRLASLTKGCADPVLFHRAALTLVPLVHKGDENIIKMLLIEVVCNPDFTKDLAEVETQIDNLTVAEYHPLPSPAITQPILATTALTKRLLVSLPSIGQDLMKNLLHSKLLEKSLVRHDCIPFLINDLVIDREEEITSLDYYWCLTPLKLLRHLNEAKPDPTSSHSKPETVVSCTKWLQMTYLLLRHRNGLSSNHTTLMGWFRHLSNVFLASNDLFLEANIISYVQASLAIILEGKGIEQMGPTEVIPDLPPCYDWYKAMLEHYASVSYGDSTFAFFIIIPLLRKWPSDYKQLLFGDHIETLRFIRLTVEDVSQFIPLEHFYCPPEEDDHLVFLYRSAIGGKLVGEKSPFLHYFVANNIKEYMRTKRTQK